MGRDHLENTHAPFFLENSYTERPCIEQVPTTVHKRSLLFRPFSPRVPCVISRSITTKRTACSARLFVGIANGRKVFHVADEMGDTELHTDIPIIHVFVISGEVITPEDSVEFIA